MKLNNIIEELERRYPKTAAEEWDNPGLLVGTDSQDIYRVFVTLDVTKEAIQEAVDWKADLIVSHHPMIFSSLRQINNHNFLGEKILTLVKENMSCYAMHTNFDVCKMAEINSRLLNLQAPQVLYPTDSERKQGIGRVGKLPFPMTLEECSQYVKTQFELPQVKVFGKLTKVIGKAAVSGGAGKSMVQEALREKAEVLITGDIDHHTGLDAWDQGLAIIDAGHYGTEYFFMKQVEEDFHEFAPELDVKCAQMKLPYQYI